MEGLRPVLRLPGPGPLDESTPAATGQLPRARAAFERVLAVRNDVGLLSEQWDPDAGRQLGNTPQAFSHIALIETAFTLTVSRSDAAPTPRTPAG
ncbi:glycoside hydrolase family 15 protein [Streptomyces aquilus]|uniref:glycoside hydrolase family 15 protein n=1 Tax=Streptomyces aquilus TaxID=2548456 RepID=UPI0037D5460F